LRVKHAEFVGQTLVASKNAIVNAYAFYIRGRKAAVPKPKLDAVVSRWVFASLLTARYSGASETAFEEAALAFRASLGYATSSESMTTDGAECALNMRFHSRGNGWSMTSSFASVGL
jgi:hypothetical protein